MTPSVWLYLLLALILVGLAWGFAESMYREEQ